MRYEEKIPGGKLVCISVECSGGRTSSVRITGDFFVHPEEALDGVEEALTGLPADSEESDVESRIDDALGGAQLIGATARDMARIFKKAVSG